MSKFPDVLYIFESRITGLFRSEKKKFCNMLSHFDTIAEAAQRDSQTVGFGMPSIIALGIAQLC